MDQPITRRKLMDMSIENGKQLQKNMTAMIAIQSRKGGVDYDLPDQLRALSAWLFKAQTGRVAEADFFREFYTVYNQAESAHDNAQLQWVIEGRA